MATPTGSEFIVTTTINDGGKSATSVTALKDGGFLVTWDEDSSNIRDEDRSGIYGQRYDAAGNVTGSSFQVASGYWEDSSVVAMDDGGFVVIWETLGRDAYNDPQPRQRNGTIYGQRYNADGSAVGNSFQVSQTDGAYVEIESNVSVQQRAATASLQDGGFIVVWKQAQSPYQLAARRYDASGNPVGNEFTVDAGVSDPSVVGLSDGGFIITATSASTLDSRGAEIFGQRYGASGNAIGNKFQINTSTNRSQFQSSVTALNNGYFVVTWVNGQSDANGVQAYEIDGQIYDAQGRAVGGEFQANTQTVRIEQHPSVSPLADGGFIVIWKASNYPSSSTDTILAQRFDAGGNKIDGEFQISAHSSGEHKTSSIAALNDGDFIVAWGQGTAFYNSEIRARKLRYEYAPTNIDLSNQSINENADGATIGTITVTDANTTDTHSITVSDSRFEIVGDQLKLKAGQNLNYESENTINLSITATDQGGLSKTQAFTLNVIDVNEAPTSIFLSNTTVAENAPSAVVGLLSTADPDTGNTHTYTVSNSRFEVVGNQLKLKAGQSLNHEATSTIPLNVTARDQNSLTKTQAFTLNVTNVNEAPTAVSLSNTTVSENAAGAVVGILSAVDPDASNTHTYTVSDSRFEVVGNQLKLKAGQSLNYEATSTIPLNVTARDQNSLSKTQAFTLIVGDVNEAPTAVSLSNTTVAENASGAVVGLLSAADPDAGNTHTYTVSDSRFEVMGNQLKLKAGQSLNHETDSTISLNVTARDQGGLAQTRAFTLTVGNVNEAPTAVSLSNTTVAENVPGAVAGLLSAADPDAGDTHTYTVNDSRFEVVGNQLKLKAGQSLNHEADSTISLDVTASDQDGLTYTQAFTLTVSDVNEAPTAVSLSNRSIAENTDGAAIGDLAVIDPDAADTYTLTVNDSRFAIIDDQLKLADGVSLDYETESTISVDVTAIDNGGLSKTQAFEIAVDNTNEAPTEIALSNVAVTENVTGAVIGDLTVTDPEANDIHTFTVSDDRFEIIGNQLKLKDGVSLDYETDAGLSVEVVAQDTGGLTKTQALTLNLGDVNEAPTGVAIQNGVTAVAETLDTSNPVKLGDIAIADDVLGTNALALIGPDASAFEIIDGGLYLKAGTQLDYQAQTLYRVSVQVDDATVGSEPDASVDYSLAITDVNLVPTDITLQNSVATLTEATDTQTRVKLADVVVADDNIGANTILLTGADADVFEVIDNVLYLKADTPLNFEAKTQYDVTVSVDDPQVGNSPDASVSYSLSITDVNEVPTALDLSSASILENAPGAVVGNITVADPDNGDTHTYSVDNGRYEVANSQLKLLDGRYRNHEATPTDVVTVTATDRDGLSIAQTFTINILDVNERPRSITLSQSDVDENLAGVVIGTLSVSDVDTDDTHTFTVSDDRFEVVDYQLKLKPGQALDYEVGSTANLRVTATDSGNLSRTSSFTLTVNNLNEAPTAIALSESLVSVNNSGAFVGTVTVTDDDAGETFTYTVSDDRFEVVNSQFKLKDAVALAANATGFITVDVTATDRSGLSTSESFELEIVSQFQTWDDVFTELSTANINLSATLEEQLRATLANGINPIENVELAIADDSVSLTYTDILSFDLGKAFDDATNTSVGSFILELAETTITFTEVDGQITTAFDALLNGEAIGLSMTNDGAYSVAYGGTIDAGPLISSLVNRLDGVSMADDFQLGIRDFDIYIEHENGKLKDFDFNVAEILFSSPDLDIADIFGNFGLTLPDWFEFDFPSFDFGIDFGFDFLSFNFPSFDLSGLFANLGFDFDLDFFKGIDFNIDLDFSGLDLGLGLDFNFTIPSLPNIDWPSLNIDLPDFMLDFFPSLDKFKLEFGADFARLTYLDDVSTGDVENLFVGLANELGIPTNFDLPNINATHPSVLVQLVNGQPQYSLEFSDVNSADAIALMANMVGFGLSTSLTNQLAAIATIDLSLSKSGIAIGYPQDVAIDLNSIPSLNSSISFIDTVADAVSNKIKAELFNNQNPVFSDARLEVQKGDDGVEFGFSGAVNGEPIGLQFTSSGVNLSYDIPDNVDFQPFANAGVDALKAFVVDDVLLSSGIGFEIQGAVDFTQNTDDFSAFISDTLGLSQIDFEVLLDTDSASISSAYSFGSNGLELFEVGNFSATLNQAGFGLEIGAGAPIFSLDGNLSLKGYDPFQASEPELTLLGGVAFDKSTVTAEFLLDANSKTWVNPFGLQGSSINQLGLQLGFTGSVVDNVGFIGNLAMPVGNGTLDAQAAFIADLTDPNKLAFDLLLNQEVDLVDLWLGPVVGLAKNSSATFKSLMGYVDDLFKPLNLEVNSYDSDRDGVKDSLIRFVPFVGAEVLGETLEQGMAVNAEVSIGDNTVGTLTLNADNSFTAIAGDLSISEIDLAGIVTLSGANDSNLDLAVAIGLSEQYVSGDAKLTILGTDVAKADFKITPTSVEIKDFDLNFFNVISLDVDNLSIDVTEVRAAGKADLKILGNTLAGVQVDISPTRLQTKASLNFFNILAVDNATIDISRSSATIGGKVKLLGQELAVANLQVDSTGLHAQGSFNLFDVISVNGNLNISQSGTATLEGDLFLFGKNFGYQALTISKGGIEFTRTVNIDTDDLVGVDLGTIALEMGMGIGGKYGGATATLGFSVFGKDFNLPRVSLESMANGFKDLAGVIVDEAFGFVGEIADKTIEMLKDAGKWIANGAVAVGEAVLDAVDGVGEFLFGKDVEKLGRGDDVYYGSNDANKVDGGSGNDRLFGYGGNDDLYGYSGKDYIDGGSGKDHLHGSTSGDTLLGGSGSDIIEGQNGTDWLYGGSGDDKIYGGYAPESVNEANEGKTDKYDYKDYIYGGSGDDRIYGHNRGDELYGESGNDYISGGEGNDWLNGGFGSDILKGGSGTDTADYSYSSSGITVNFSNVKTDYTSWRQEEYVEVTFPASGNSEKLYSIEKILGSKAGDTLKGDSKNNEFDGYWGDDHLYGQAGNDTLKGGDGDDYLSGDSGNDILYGGTGKDHLRGGDGDDYLYGGAGDDYLNGDSHKDYLYGGTGNDILRSGYEVYGEEGDDILYSEYHYAKLYGGEGDDVLYDMAGSDLYGGSGTDRYVIKLWARGNNTLSATRINDMAGDEKIIISENEIRTWYDKTGQLLTDIQPSNFRFTKVSSTQWRLDFVAGQSREIARIFVQDSSTKLTVEDNIVLEASGNETGVNSVYKQGYNEQYGLSGNDILRASEYRSDNLDGGTGNDILLAKPNSRNYLSNDILKGGEGQDIFVFDYDELSGGKEFQRLEDFNAAEDKIVILNTFLSANNISVVGNVLKFGNRIVADLGSASQLDQFSTANVETYSRSYQRWMASTGYDFQRSSTSGKTSNKYITGAYVFFDANLNGIRDLDEPFAYSDSEGNYEFDTDLSEFDFNGNGVLDVEEGQLVSQGGLDAYSGSIVTNTFTAPVGYDMITPVTTLVNSLVQQGQDAGIAEEQVKQALGLSQDVELSTFDAIAEMAVGNPEASKVMAAHVTVNTIIEQTTSLLMGAVSQTGDSFEPVALTSDLVSTSITNLIADQIKSGQSLDLADANQVNSLLTQTVAAVQARDPEANWQQVLDIAEQAAQVMADGIQSTAALLQEEGADAETLLTKVAKMQAYLVDETASDLQAAAAGEKDIAEVVAENNIANVLTLPDDAITNYLASNPDLIATIGTDLEAVKAHYAETGFFEGRETDTFDADRYLASNPDLIAAVGYDLEAAKQHFISNGYSEGRITTAFIPELYLESNPDLQAAFGDDLAAATQHYIEVGYAEGRDPWAAFNPAEYIASHDELIATFGTDYEAAKQHFIEEGYEQGLTATFQAEDYLASHPDLIEALGFDLDAAVAHFIQYGAVEGRSQDSFDAETYLSLYPDLQDAFSDDLEAATQHYIQHGYGELRDPVNGGFFNSAEYIASYDDLIAAFGDNPEAGEQHYRQYGRSEGRKTTFQSDEYLASYDDLIDAFGYDLDSAVSHFITYGSSEGRARDRFDAEAYLNAFGDLQATFGKDLDAATKHYIEFGHTEGRAW